MVLTLLKRAVASNDGVQSHGVLDNERGRFAKPCSYMRSDRIVLYGSLWASMRLKANPKWFLSPWM
jgi:hypothetical protein